MSGAQEQFDRRAIMAGARCVVVKIGSALITDNGSGLQRERIADWSRQIAALVSGGRSVVLVSSGSVAEGIARLGWNQRPEQVAQLQAAAAVGQMGLVQAWESGFQACGLHTAQILLGHDDISARDRYLNARAAMQALLAMRVVPVVNENDTVVTDEIRLGDNDSLAALVANLLDADALLILTDQEGLFTADPRKFKDAQKIEQALADAPELDAMASPVGGRLGRGGMATKLRAARLAGRSGACTVIANGMARDAITEIIGGAALGTLLMPANQKSTARKNWLAGRSVVHGELTLDDGACRVLRERGSSLLPVGVVAVSGSFERGDLVRCLNRQGLEVARGLVNYNATDTAKIRGRASSEIVSVLGYGGDAELIHRDNLVLS